MAKGKGSWKLRKTDFRTSSASLYQAGMEGAQLAPKSDEIHQTRLQQKYC